jgi:hypothetical protein
MNTIQLSQKFSAIEQEISEIKAALIEANILKAPAPPLLRRNQQQFLATDVKVTQRFRASVQHPFTVLANFTCPACALTHEQVEFRIGENGGTTTTACSCGSNLRVKLSWDPSMK